MRVKKNESFPFSRKDILQYILHTTDIQTYYRKDYIQTYYIQAFLLT